MIRPACTIAPRCRGHQAASAGFLAFSALALPARAQDPGGPTAVARPVLARPVVARLELAAPARSPFLLHATIPVPKGIFPRQDHRSPLAILDHGEGAALVPAQVQIVSRYPTGEADVIEVFAPVHLGTSESRGSRVGYSVVLSESEVAREPQVPDRVADLLARTHQGRFGLRARDVYGNTYWADLSGNPKDPGFGSVRLLKNGAWLRERRIYATMMPVGSPGAQGPPLPHLLGVHAYVAERAGEDQVELDLRINNGAISGSAPASPLEATLGIVYWRNLQLVLPEDWTAVSQVRDPFLGEPFREGASRVIPLVKSLAGGRLHMMGPQAQLERRLILVPAATGSPSSTSVAADSEGATPARPATKAPRALGDPKAAGVEQAPVDPSLFDPGLAFCTRGKDLWSWFEPATARYFPQRDLLASFGFVRRRGLGGNAAIRAQLAGNLAALRTGLASGQPKGYYVTAPVMGWAHPWFVKEQGSVGGEGIATFEGYYAAVAAARDDVEYLSLLHRMNVCRQPQASYNRFGDVVGYHEWLDAQGRVPFDFRLNGGVLMPPFLLPCMRGPAASPQVFEVVKRNLRPPYDLGNPYETNGTWPDRGDCLLAWWPHDDQHYIRWTKQPKALVWLANDSMARDDLILAAEMYHLARHESPHILASWSQGKTLLVFESIARAHPHQGLALGREDAWGIDAMCAAYSVASSEWREKNRAWFDRMSQVLLDGAMPSGIVQRFYNVQLLGTDRYAATQTFESLFLIHAMRCMNESVFRGVDDPRRAELEKLAVRGIDYLFFGPVWGRVPNHWQPDPAHATLFWNGPRQGIAVAFNDEFKTPPFCDESRWGKNYLPPDGLGLGVEWFHPWAALSYAQEITNATAGAGLENKYLKRAIDCGKGHTGWKNLIQDFAEQASDPTYDNSANWIGLLGKLQSLGLR